MNGTVAEARALASAVREGVKRPRGIEVVLCPPFTALSAVGEVLAGSAIGLAAQNCHWERQGAFTGEISPPMLAELGCSYVIVGHSERRQHFGESDPVINLKLKALLTVNLTPILCVGETAEERRQGLTFTIVEGQVRGALAGLDASQISRCVLAYEPIWAIGTGVNATPAQASEVHGYLRGLLSELASKEIAQSVRILYGGSIKPETMGELIQEKEIDGGLVGGASLQAQSFLSIIKKATPPRGVGHKE
jgi:triosephosphate isomerase